VDKTYRAELKEFKEMFLTKCKNKEKSNIAERIREEKAMRLRDIIKNKEIENAKENLEKLIKEKELLDAQGIKPAPEYTLSMGGLCISTASLTDNVRSSSSTAKENK
jgi:hypothetical protein